MVLRRCGTIGAANSTDDDGVNFQFIGFHELTTTSMSAIWSGMPKASVHHLGSFSGVQPVSSSSIRKVSLHMPLKDNLRCSGFRVPSRHSFSPSHNHHVPTFPVEGSTTPVLNVGNGFSEGGTEILSTMDTIFLFTAAERGKKTENAGSPSVAVIRSLGATS